MDYFRLLLNFQKGPLQKVILFLDELIEVIADGSRVCYFVISTDGRIGNNDRRGEN